MISGQLRYAMAYVLITALVLVFLNIYAPAILRRLVIQSQMTAMEDKAQLMLASFSEYEVLDADLAEEVIASMNDLHTTRVIVTDAGGYTLYDSLAEVRPVGRLMLLPAVVEALSGNDALYVIYRNGTVESQAAMPITSYNKLIGAVYLMQYDTDLGALIHSLEYNLMRISVVLEIVVVLISVMFSLAFSRRLRKIIESIRQMRDGNYTTTIDLRGSDEVAVLAEDFNALAERLAQSEEVRKQFVSNASHELKTPLASIKLLTDSILQNEMDAETIREFVTDIGSEADRLTRLSEKLLELTRLDSQREEDSLEIVDVGLVGERVLRMLLPLAEKQEITIHSQVEDGCTILSREDDLYQVIFNLTENGIKYNRDRGHLFLQIRHSEETVMIQVEDTGLGIPEDAVEHIFERFYRVDKARSRRAGGAGLGLSIVHDMVERYDGTVQVEKGAEGGSVFTVEFPFFEMEVEE